MKLKGVEPEFGSLEETFLIKVFNLEREAKLYETMLIALSSLGAEPKKVKSLMDEYVQVLYPEHDMSQDSFLDKAQKTLDRHLGKPFIIDPMNEETFVLRPEIEAEED